MSYKETPSFVIIDRLR